MAPTTPPQPEREPHVLEYRPRAANPAPRVGAHQWLEASMALGVLAWLTMVFLCAGGWLPWLPIGFAAAGFGTGLLAAVHPLSRETSMSALFAMFMSFTVLATWLLILGLF